MVDAKIATRKAVEPEDDGASDYTFFDMLLELLLPVTMLAHLFMAPYTKVEESFNIQAIHDIVNFGTPVPFHNAAQILAKYDHVEFPGVVPRSFAGASLIGGSGSVVLGFIKDGMQQQIIVRAFLGLLNCSVMIMLARRAGAVFSRGTARWYLLLQASQFHVMFYVSRTLPNMMAFGMVTYALAELLPPPRSLSARKDWFDAAPIGLQVLIVAAVIFRCELAILFFTSLVPLIATGWISIFPELLVLGGATGILAVGTAVSIDTFFWQTFPKPMWAELQGFLFNTVEGKSSEWGTSPFHYYFTNAIPKMMLNPMALLVLLPIGIFAGGWKRTTERIVGPAISFVAIYSLLPHKEWRFIVYVMPALTLVAAVGADWIFTQRKKSIVNFAANMALFTTVAMTFAAAFGMSYVSSLNYPGGQALKELDLLVGDREHVSVHMDVYTCMTGATRFTQNNLKHPGWKYSKEEDKAKLANPAFWAEKDYALTRSPGFLVSFFPNWEIKKPVQGYAGVTLWKQGKDSAEPTDIMVGGRRLAQAMLGYTGGRWPMIRMRDQVWIVGRKGAEKKMDGFEDVKLNDASDKGNQRDEL
ncbi:hypothetical protein H072_7091 [Dactylellina haptotyla CBS 200.50]|uniref:Mannosyltransferase n=1 Tax=Dactylellina haptotyla (strain CBS 200.50) TaxID=1284197 RepID=S8ADE5_DACHA|nr:hypothetical protein H072_7091 [Dactylellina haptotyla CBS 200.50]